MKRDCFFLEGGRGRENRRLGRKSPVAGGRAVGGGKTEGLRTSRLNGRSGKRMAQKPPYKEGGIISTYERS